MKWWNVLEKKEVLPLKHQNMRASERDKEIDQWARVLEQVERLDHIEGNDIIDMLKWLIDVNGFWVSKGLQGLSSLRKDTKGNGRKIDLIYSQWRSSKKGHNSSNIDRPVDRQRFTEYEARRVKEAYPDIASKIEPIVMDEAGREYIYFA
jgi:hypothetical protein